MTAGAFRIGRVVILSMCSVGTGACSSSAGSAGGGPCDPGISPECDTSGCDYYVSVCGANTNGGTSPTSAWRSMRYAAASISPGDRLCVFPGGASGGYESDDFGAQTPSGTSGAPTAIRAACPDDRPVLTAPNAWGVTSFVNGQHHILLDGFVIDGTDITHTVLRLSTATHHITVQNCEVKNGPNSGVSTTYDSHHHEFINLDVHNNGTDDFDHGLYISGDNNLIESCRIYDNAGWGVHIYYSFPDTAAPDSNIVRNNLIYENHAAGDRGVGIGIYAGGDGNQAYNNVLWGNKDGIVIDDSTDSAVFNNTVYGNTNYGIWITGRSANALVVNNITDGNSVNDFFDQSTSTDAGYNLIGGDPMFVDAANHDFHLQRCSAAIDAGDGEPIDINGLETDHDGNPREYDSPFTIGSSTAGSVPVVDIGAYEWAGDCNDNGVADSADLEAGTSNDNDENAIPDECESGTDDDDPALGICNAVSGT